LSSGGFFPNIFFFPDNYFKVVIPRTKTWKARKNLNGTKFHAIKNMKLL
jgi:hypothetical protein